MKLSTSSGSGGDSGHSLSCMDLLLFYIVIGVTVLGLGWTVFFVFFRSNVPDQDESSGDGDSSSGKSRSKNSVEKKGSKVKLKTSKGRSVSASEQSDDHAWQISILKGHSENITGLHWSSNGKYLASCASDRTVLVWLAKEKDLLCKDHKNVRVNIPFDSAGKVYWSPDCKAFVVSRVDEKFLEVYKLGKKPDGSVGNITSAVKFNKFHDEEVVGLGIACHGKFMVSASSDGHLVISNLKGTILEQLRDNKNIDRVKVSNCGRYIALCGPNRDVIVYEVTFVDDKYKEAKIKWKLTGHESNVCDFDFNTDSSKIVTVTEKGNWRLFDTTGSRVNVTFEGTVGTNSGTDEKPTIALSPDCRIIAVGFDQLIHVFIGKLGAPGPLASSWKLPCETVNALMFSSDGKFIVAGSGRNIRVFHNVAGYHAATADLKLQMQDSTVSQALKTRLSNELQSALKDMRRLKIE